MCSLRPPNCWQFFLFPLPEKQKFILRCHAYQARSLIGSDASGLSGESSTPLPLPVVFCVTFVFMCRSCHFRCRMSSTWRFLSVTFCVTSFIVVFTSLPLSVFSCVSSVFICRSCQLHCRLSFTSRPLLVAFTSPPLSFVVHTSLPSSIFSCVTRVSTNSLLQFDFISWASRGRLEVSNMPGVCDLKKGTQDPSLCVQSGRLLRFFTGCWHMSGPPLRRLRPRDLHAPRERHARDLGNSQPHVGSNAGVQGRHTLGRRERDRCQPSHNRHRDFWQGHGGECGVYYRRQKHIVLTLSPPSSISTLSQPFKRDMYEWVCENW